MLLSGASCCLLSSRPGRRWRRPRGSGVNAWPTLKLQGPTPSYSPAPALLGAEQTAILGAALAEATKAPIVSGGSCWLPPFPGEPSQNPPQKPESQGQWAPRTVSRVRVGVLEVAVSSCLWDSSKDKDSADRRTGCQVLGPHLLCPPLYPSTQHMAILTTDFGNK